jgi:4-amino-4-deoxy-L-arabinose transferase-like glycosyltransferase
MKGIKVSGPWEIVLVVAVCICAFFVNNQVITPDIMESRNIIAAREMVYDGHWITPTMNGDLRLEKPPLPTWLTAVAEMASPDNVALQRAMAGLAALLLVFYFWRFARKVLDIDPLAPTLLLVTCYNVILMGRTASWDIYCHAFMMGGIYYLARGLSGKSHQWGNFIASGVFIGLSIMSKGPVSLYALFLPFLLSYPFFYRHPMRGKTWPLVTMILLALIIGTWWFIYIHLTQTEALEAVALK